MTDRIVRYQQATLPGPYSDETKASLSDEVDVALEAIVLKKVSIP